MKPSALGIIYILVSILLYSIMPILIRLLGAGHLPPASQVFFRYIVACVMAYVYFRLMKSKFEIAKKDRLLIFFVALFGYALTNLMFTYAALLTQVGTLLFIFFSSSIITPVLAHFFLKERMGLRTVIAIIIGCIALFVLFNPSSVDTWRIGAIFALAAAVGNSWYVIGRRKLKTYDSNLLLLINTVVGVVTLCILSIVLEGRFYTDGLIYTVTPMTWFVTILFGIDNFAAWLFMTKGFQLVAAGTGSMLMLLENVLGIAFAYLVFAEIPSAGTLIGGVLITIASLLVLTNKNTS